jgi:hypothetical protein
MPDAFQLFAVSALIGEWPVASCIHGAQRLPTSITPLSDRVCAGGIRSTDGRRGGGCDLEQYLLTTTATRRPAQ